LISFDKFFQDALASGVIVATLVTKITGGARAKAKTNFFRDDRCGFAWSYLDLGASSPGKINAGH
jgi:hypothetical protein